MVLLLTQPLLDVSVATYGHRGLLGIVASPPSPATTATLSNNHGNRNTTKYVFLYYTQSRLILVMILQKETTNG